MSYLNNLLASIGGDGPPTQAPSNPPRAPPPIQKRKAEEDLTSGLAKRPTTPSNNQNGAVKRPATPNDIQIGQVPKPKPATTSGGSEYKGSARPSGSSQAQKPVPKPISISSPAVGPKQVQKAATTPTTSASPAGDKPTPKQGSYAAILARAKAAQGSKAAVGLITHKQIDKVSKKERAAEARGKTASIRDKVLSDRSRTGSAEVPTKVAEKEKRKSNEITYKGSAKPSAPAYKGTAGLKSKHAKQGSKRNDGYADWSDLDDVEDDEEGDYVSDESSDMEAGAFDIEHEEELSLREAKKADAEELARENAHKAAKMKRNAALQKLVDAKSKKKPAY